MTAPAPRRLYLDNAATSFPKPQSVLSAMTRFATEIGASAGRGGYQSSIDASQILTQCRQRIARLINAENPDQIVFTLNGTDALSTAIFGMLQRAAPRGGDASSAAHVICSALDHNSVLRPLARLEADGAITVTRLGVSGVGLIDPEAVRRAITPATRLVILTHASNVTGSIQPLREIGRICRERAVPLLVDAAQTAGHIPIDVREDLVDVLATPGHKAMLGPLGTGFLYIRPGVEKLIRPLRDGGTGSASDSERQPETMPDKFEAGSHNVIGIAGLSAGVQWLLDQGVAKLAEHDLDLVRTFIEGVSGVEGLKYYGPQGVRNRLGLFSVSVEGLEPYELSAILESSYGILTRPGLHCAPRMHEFLGTAALGGTVRFSFSPFLTKQDVKFVTDALAEIAAERA